MFDAVDALPAPIGAAGPVGARPAKVLKIVASDVELIPAGNNGAAHAFIHELIEPVDGGALRQGRKQVVEPTTVDEGVEETVEGGEPLGPIG